MGDVSLRMTSSHPQVFKHIRRNISEGHLFRVERHTLGLTVFYVVQFVTCTSQLKVAFHFYPLIINVRMTFKNCVLTKDSTDVSALILIYYISLCLYVGKKVVSWQMAALVFHYKF